MNGRQAAKLAAKRIEDLELYNAQCKADIVKYNRCIDSVIAGEKTFCDWCEDKEECQLEAKGTGCHEWLLTFDSVNEEDDADDSEGVHVTGAEGRA